MASLFSKTKRKRSKKTEDSDDTEQLFFDKKIKNEETIEGVIDDSSKNSSAVAARTNNINSFEDLGLAGPLVEKCKSLFKRPTPVQRTVIPFLLHDQYHKTKPPVVLVCANTGQGKTATFVLPILHHLALDPYGIYAVIVTPTRELAKQIHQQVLALGSAYNVSSALVVGGLDLVGQSTQLDRRPHFCVATPGRLAELLRGPHPPRLKQLRYLVLDEADRLLATNSNSGFERDVAELLLHCCQGNNEKCQVLLFSATMTKSLAAIQELAKGSSLQKFVIQDESHQDALNEKNLKNTRIYTAENNVEYKQGDGDDDDDEDDDESEELTPKIPEGLTQEYIFMPSRVRDAYLLTALRNLLISGGRVEEQKVSYRKRNHKENKKRQHGRNDNNTQPPKVEEVEDNNLYNNRPKARLAIIFVSTCERAALVSCMLEEAGVANVALHSLLSQSRRLAALAKFKSEHVRVLVATDVASRGLGRSSKWGLSSWLHRF